jgi:diguanylate cyclase (GGDEF)-like protein
VASIERDFSEAVKTTARTALDVVPFAMLIVDASAQALAVNTRWSALSELSGPDSLASGWLSVLEPESRVRLRETVMRVGAEGGTGAVDLQLGSGSRNKWIRWWASRHQIEDATVVAVAAADIDEDYQRQANLYHQATHDALTGLLNRSHFLECTEQALRRSARQQRHVAVVYVDLDDFKRVNDRGGHLLGDRVLHAIAARLRHAVRSADLVARIGGDEFAVLCEGLTAGEQADVVARRVTSALGESVELDGQRWPVAASVGIAVDGGENEAAEALMDRADRAMYSVKMTRRPSATPGAEPATPQPERDRTTEAPTTTPPYAVFDADAARRALRELVEGGSNWSGPRSPSGRASYPSASGPRPEQHSGSPSGGPGGLPAVPPAESPSGGPLAPPTAGAGAGAGDGPYPGPAAREPSGSRRAETAHPGSTATMTRPSEAGNRERLAREVITLRDSIDSIRTMLDRLLEDDLAGTGVIDIRD